MGQFIILTTIYIFREFVLSMNLKGIILYVFLELSWEESSYGTM